jgi:hypothetical protein
MAVSVGFALRKSSVSDENPERMWFQMLIAHEVFEKMSIGTLAS